MEVFGFKSKRVYRCFQLKYLILFMMLIHCSWTQDSIPSFNVTCDTSGLYVKIAFSKPFTGIVYAKGYRFDRLCSISEFSAMNGSLFIPLSACGTYVQETDQPWITNTVIIQQHPLIRTANDFEKSLICSLQSSESFYGTQLSLDQIYESYSLPLMESSSDIQFLSEVFHENKSKSFDNTPTRLTLFRLSNRTTYEDVGIKSCVVHNEGILDGNASIHRISSPEGCFSVNSKDSSGFLIAETDEGLMAYVDIETLGVYTSDNVYLTCEVILCKSKCRCSDIAEGEHTTSVISHKLTKRSADNISDMFSKQYESRARFLKSTVKALMDKIMEQRKQNDKNKKVRKRLMRLEDSTFVSETNSEGSGLTHIGIVSLEPVATNLHNIEPDDDYESDDYNSDDYESDLESSHAGDWEETSVASEIPTVGSGIAVTMSEELEDNSNKTVLEDETQEKCSRVLVADFVPTGNEVTENTKIHSTSDISFPSAVDIHVHSDSCVPKLKFVVTTVVMGFFMGCLLLVSCGMALYIRKEKKRNKINDFLLYSMSY